jgi:hypothetical protein
MSKDDDTCKMPGCRKKRSWWSDFCRRHKKEQGRRVRVIRSSQDEDRRGWGK